LVLLLSAGGRGAAGVDAAVMDVMDVMGGMDGACAVAEPIPLNETIRQHRREPHGSDHFRLSVPSAGILLLHGSVPASAGTAPHLRLAGRGCSGGGYVVLRESPAGLLVRISKRGDFLLAVSPEDPSEPLFRYKLQTVFAAEPEQVDEVVSFAGDPTASCAADGLPSFTPEPLGASCFVELRRDVPWTKDVDPIDCDVVTGGLTAPGVLVVESEDPVGVALYSGTDCDPEDRRAEGVLGARGAFVAAPVHAGDYRLDLQLFRPTSYSVDVKYFALCGLGERDDHLDVPLCATPLAAGTGAGGTIGDVSDDDEDYFTFALDAPATVKVGVRSAESLSAALYDEDGQRLAAWGACGGGCGRGMVRALGRGRYYVRVASAGASGGDYRVSMSRLVAP
jgi:hypothetical protein